MKDKKYDKEEQKAVQSALAKMEMEDPQIKKWKQQMAALEDKIERKKKSISEKERKERTRRLIVLGGMVESVLDTEAPEGSDIFMALMRCYMPLVRDEMKSGRFKDRLDKVKAEDEKKAREKEAAEKAKEKNNSNWNMITVDNEEE